MSKVFRYAVLSSVAAMAAVASAAGDASAQGRIISFGDSLTDNGNLVPLSAAPGAPYYNGRFSNGITWTEILSGGRQNSPYFTGAGITGNVNFAFGNARTDLNASPTGGTTPGIPLQINQFTAVGGVIGAKDLVTVWGGANNVLQYLQANAFNGTLTQASIGANSVAAATSELASVQTLISRGARSLLIANLPDVGATPQLSPTALAGGGSLGAATFNSALSQGLRQVAAASPGVNIVQMDMSTAFAAIINNAAAFGFTNVTQQCLTTVACVTGSTATQNKYLFWDGVHPTAAGHALIAQYASLLLNPTAGAARSAPLAEVGTFARMNAADEILDRNIGWARGAYQQQNGFYAQLTGTHGNQNGRDGGPSYTFNLGGARLGLDQQFGTMLVGGAVGVGAGSIGGNSLKADNVGVFDADVYATKLYGPMFVTVQAGGSIMEADIVKRATGFGPLMAAGQSGQGRQAGANVESGVILKTGGFNVIPSARLGYVYSKVGAYEESGLLAMAFSDRTTSAAIGAARVRAVSDLSFGSFGGNAFAEVGYERFFSSSADAVNARFVNNTALPFSAAVPDLASRGLNFKVGVDGKLSATYSVSLQYGLSLEDGQGQVHTGQARVKVPF
jgi:outer membrane lipase/esterase